jgi:hypothetical protein
VVVPIHPAFLDDPQSYARARAYWVDLWERIDPVQRRRDHWETPWLSDGFADGSPINDGNPIFSAVSRSNAKGIRIIQVPPEQDEVWDFWLDTFGGLSGDPGIIDELVIYCALSQRTAVDAFSLMNSWVHGDIQRDERTGFACPASRRE